MLHSASCHKRRGNTFFCCQQSATEGHASYTDIELDDIHPSTNSIPWTFSSHSCASISKFLDFGSIYMIPAGVRVKTSLKTFGRHGTSLSKLRMTWCQIWAGKSGRLPHHCMRVCKLAPGKLASLLPLSDVNISSYELSLSPAGQRSRNLQT